MIMPNNYRTKGNLIELHPYTIKLARLNIEMIEADNEPGKLLKEIDLELETDDSATEPMTDDIQDIPIYKRPNYIIPPEEDWLRLGMPLAADYVRELCLDVFVRLLGTPTDLFAYTEFDSSAGIVDNYLKYNIDGLRCFIENPDMVTNVSVREAISLENRIDTLGLYNQQNKTVAITYLLILETGFEAEYCPIDKTFIATKDI